MNDATKNLNWFGTAASVPPLRKEKGVDNVKTVCYKII
jgi:hypothetical protein